MDNEQDKIKEELEQEFPTTETGNDEGELQQADEASNQPEEVEDGTREGEEVREEIPEGGKPTEIEEDQKTEVEDTEDSNTSEDEVSDTASSEETTVVEEGEDKGETQEEIDATPVVSDEVKELKSKLEELEFEKEINSSIADYEKLVDKNKRDLAEFHEVLKSRIADECARYGVPMDMSVDEMKQVAPDKFNILSQILHKADEVTNGVINEIKNSEALKAQEVIFKRAGKAMAKFKLTEDQIKEASNTFVKIMHESGIRDLGEDLEAKVELAVAYAKMIHKDLEKTSDDVIKTVEDAKEVVEDVKETTKDVKEAVEKVVTPIKKDLDAFKEGVKVTSESAAGAINEDNVMEVYLSKQGKDRQAFFKEYQDLLAKVCRRNGGAKYTDNRRRY